MQTYYWQHEDTGRVCETDFEDPPSKRWYAIGKKDYEEYLEHQSMVLPDYKPKGRDVLHDARNPTPHAAVRRGAFIALQEEIRLCECGHALHQHQQVWLDNYAIATRKQCKVKDCGCSSFRPPSGR